MVIEPENLMLTSAMTVEEGGTLCSICYETYSEDSFFSLACDHRFCKDCVLSHLKAAIDSEKVLLIPCPSDTECTQTYLTKDIELFC
jgi:hypothetical protein